MNLDSTPLAITAHSARPTRRLGSNGAETNGPILTLGPMKPMASAVVAFTDTVSSGRPSAEASDPRNDSLVRS